MKRSFVILFFLLSACGPGGNLVLPGTTGSSLDLPVNTVENWYQQMLNVPPGQIMTLIRMGSKVVGLLKFVSGRGSTKAEID